MPHMYILECADGSYYTGSTWDLERRLREHQAGLGANHTAKRLPVKLVYCEHHDRVEDAFHREKQVQGWSRRKKQVLIAENYEKLVEYSRNYTQFPPAASAASTSSAAEAAALPLPEPVEGSDANLKELGYGG
ncbi:MAG: GIY-YIG nuclease family protein [Chthonomonadales bacterium]|nr:GIY-YIG nuclease family protein [Chthonomonadales bacterium]